MNKKVWIALSLVILGSFSFAKGRKFLDTWSDICKDHITHFDNLQVQTGSFSDGVCFLSLHPMNVNQDLVYRDYLITSENFLMVFNSFGRLMGGGTTGAREYYFLPRNEVVAYRHNADTQELEVKLANADILRFSEAKAELVGSIKGKVQLRAEIDPKFRGGVEFIHYNGILFDGGWATDRSPTSNKAGFTQIRNSKEQLCKIVNSKLYDYKGDDHRLLQDDRQLSKIIKKQCPSFSVEF